MSSDWAGDDFRGEVRPGLTGLAQFAGAESSDETLAFDRAYVARWRPLLDCQMIALSFAVNAFGKLHVRRLVHGRLRRISDF